MWFYHRIRKHFLSITCLPHSQLWVNVGGSLTHLMLISAFYYLTFNPKVTRSPITRLVSKAAHPMGLWQVYFQFYCNATTLSWRRSPSHTETSPLTELNSDRQSWIHGTFLQSRRGNNIYSFHSVTITLFLSETIPLLLAESTTINLITAHLMLTQVYSPLYNCRGKRGGDGGGGLTSILWKISLPISGN